jgi:NADH-quinone oxidoreductase subunit G
MVEKKAFRKACRPAPLIGIDRERCILCYRCVRFSQEVSEDSQLQLLERGDRSYVGTFDDRPYIAPFQGNITELCPVGALTSYTYRFRARPWDIGQRLRLHACPAQCNVSFTVRDRRSSACWRTTTRKSTTAGSATKGASLPGSTSQDRITEPLLLTASSCRQLGCARLGRGRLPREAGSRVCRGRR